MNLVQKQTSDLSRLRVRTPGKHIVAFAAAALLMVAATLSLARLARPNGAEPTGPPPASADLAPIEASRVVLPEILVDLAPDRNGRVAYLRLVATVRAGRAALDAIEARGAEIRERLSFLFRGLSAEDLSDEERLRLAKTEMLRRINLVIAPLKADEVIVSEIVVQ